MYLKRQRISERQNIIKRITFYFILKYKWTKPLCRKLITSYSTILQWADAFDVLGIRLTLRALNKNQIKGYQTHFIAVSPWYYTLLILN